MRASSESAYRSPAGERVIRQWCRDRLASWPVEHECHAVPTSTGTAHVTTVRSPGSGRGPVVLIVPGTSANATTYLALAERLAAHWETGVLDLPGQPGLSAATRPRRNRLPWYGQCLSEVIAELRLESVIVCGHSLGGAVALSATSPRIAARVLLGPAGLTRARLEPATLAPTLPWMVKPTPTRSAALIRRFLAPGSAPAPRLVEWFTLVATYCRTTLAPAPLPHHVLTRARRDGTLVVASGCHDTFFPPPRLARPAGEWLGVPTRAVPHSGHFLTEECPEAIVTIVEEVAAAL